MDSKLQYDVDHSLERVSLTKIQQKAMKIWLKTEENSEMFDLVKELIDTIETEQRKIEDVKSMIYMIAGKL